MLRATVWMLRATVWMLRAMVWMLTAMVWMLRGVKGGCEVISSAPGLQEQNSSTYQ